MTGARLVLAELGELVRQRFSAAGVVQRPPPAGRHYLDRVMSATNPHVVAHARVEDRIRTGKDSGFGRFPSRAFTTNRGRQGSHGLARVARTELVRPGAPHCRPLLGGWCKSMSAAVTWQTSMVLGL
jgi:hypothetical protein